MGPPSEGSRGCLACGSPIFGNGMGTREHCSKSGRPRGAADHRHQLCVVARALGSTHRADRHVRVQALIQEAARVANCDNPRRGSDFECKVEAWLREQRNSCEAECFRQRRSRQGARICGNATWDVRILRRLLSASAMPGRVAPMPECQAWPFGTNQCTSSRASPPNTASYLWYSGTSGMTIRQRYIRRFATLSLRVSKVGSSTSLGKTRSRCLSEPDLNYGDARCRKKSRKKETFGGCDIDHIRPAPTEGIPPALNTVVGFEDAPEIASVVGPGSCSTQRLQPQHVGGQTIGGQPLRVPWKRTDHGQSRANQGLGGEARALIVAVRGAEGRSVAPRLVFVFTT